MTHNMKIKYPFYISENPFIYSLFHTAGFVFHSVKQRICHSKITYIQKGKDVLSILKQKSFRTRQETVMSFRIQMSCIV